MTGTISSAGIGSGLDVNSIITSLMNVEKLPLTKLQTTGTVMQTKLSAFGQIQSLVSSLNDAVAPLSKASSYALLNASSSDATSVTASAGYVISDIDSIERTPMLVLDPPPPHFVIIEKNVTARSTGPIANFSLQKQLAQSSLAKFEYS